MRFLDIGCGSGDVALLAADLVGASGKVVGVDCERRAVDWANSRATLQGIANVNFLEGDPAEMECDQCGREHRGLCRTLCVWISPR
jgi:ubiquinone/menaquinone biosynthesis C-methylase UbiE